MNNKKSRRQIIFLMTDTPRKDMLGCYGNPEMKTPNLDKLASQGIRYENAYTCQPVCGPARSAHWLAGIGIFVTDSTAVILENGIWTEAIILDWARAPTAGIQNIGMICGVIWRNFLRKSG